MNLLMQNATLVLSDGLLPNAWLMVKDGNIEAFSNTLPPPSHPQLSVFDANGLYLAPGFVDLHIHGGGGADFRDADTQAYRTILRTHLQGGTTAMMPTLSSCTNQTTFSCLQAYNALCQEEAGRCALPHLLGIHMEGPYFSNEQRGAQDETILRMPDIDEALSFLQACPSIRRWAIAPELPGAIELGRALCQQGVTVCAGHSSATTTQLEHAFHSGYSCVTHLYSGCSLMHRNGPFREGGVVEGAFLLNEMDVEVIADGCHLPQELLRLIYQIKGRDRIALITDSTRGGGMEYPDGTELYDDIQHRRKLIVEQGVAMMPDKKNFAGSIATTMRLVRTMVTNNVASLCDAVRMASLTPARMAGVAQTIGSIAVGKQADFVLFDCQFDIAAVLLRGNIAYRNEREK